MPKSSSFGCPSAIDQHVGGLEIPMQDQPLVSGMHRGTDETEQERPLCDVES